MSSSPTATDATAATQALETNNIAATNEQTPATNENNATSPASASSVKKTFADDDVPTTPSRSAAPKTPTAAKAKEPQFESTKDKLVWKLKQKVNSRKAFSKLGVKDIALWKNPIASAAVFIAGQLLFYMLCRWELTLALVIGRILLFQIAICSAYVIGMRILAPNREIITPAQMEITPENVREFLGKLSDRIYAGLAWYISVLLLKDIKVTVTLFLGLELFNRILAKRLSTASLIYLGFNLTFILPVVYELFEDEILEGVMIAQKKTNDVIHMAQKKIQQFKEGKKEK